MYSSNVLFLNAMVMSILKILCQDVCTCDLSHKTLVLFSTDSFYEICFKTMIYTQISDYSRERSAGVLWRVSDDLRKWKIHHRMIGCTHVRWYHQLQIVGDVVICGWSEIIGDVRCGFRGTAQSILFMLFQSAAWLILGPGLCRCLSRCLWNLPVLGLGQK